MTRYRCWPAATSQAVDSVGRRHTGSTAVVGPADCRRHARAARAIAPTAGRWWTRCARSRAAGGAGLAVNRGVDIVEPPFLFEMQRRPARGDATVHARRPADKSTDEITCSTRPPRWSTASTRTSWRRSSRHPENESSHWSTSAVRDGSTRSRRQRGHGERATASAQLLRRLIRPRPGVLRHHPLYNGYRPATTTFAWQFDPSQRDAYTKARE